jgi:DNA mismatch repair protein MutL
MVLASNMAIKSGQKLQEKEMEGLIDQLFACEMPYSLPNGKPIVITLSLEELGKKFQY